MATVSFGKVQHIKNDMEADKFIKILKAKEKTILKEINVDIVNRDELDDFLREIGRL